MVDDSPILQQEDFQVSPRKSPYLIMRRWRVTSSPNPHNHLQIGKTSS